ncbi:MAG: NHL repeat-containing protein [Deltaproteobacteria bacterium]|nr:NHL repeat-containing protein [Deltaproteobacteria bacterium]
MKIKPLFAIVLLSVLLFPDIRLSYAKPKYQELKYLFTIEKKEDRFKHPSDVAISEDGLAYVLDGVNNRVVVFDGQGEYLYEFGKGGSGEGEFDMPLGLSLDRKGNVYVADSGNHRIVALSPKGDFLYEIQVPPEGTKNPDPTDTVVDKRRKLLYMVDNENHVIYTYNLRRKRFVRSIGEMGLGKIKVDLRWPFTLDIDRKGNVYVVDVINTRVRVLSPEGRFTVDVGEWGVDSGQYFRPKGVAVDSKGRIYVSDSFLGVIQAFDSDGNFLALIGDEKNGIKKFITPIRISFDKDDRLYVVEQFAHKVSVFELK